MGEEIRPYGRFDVCILAGGRGSRLKGVWDHAKCLVPVGGVPLIERLLNMIVPLDPQRIVLALGHYDEEVVTWLHDENLRRLIPAGIDLRTHREKFPSGTAGALRDSLQSLGSTVLVLNGDTLPLYSLPIMMKTLSMTVRPFPIVAAWHEGAYAGAAMFYEDGLRQLAKMKATDLDDLLKAKAARYPVLEGYFDVGTPEAFAAAQTFSPTGEKQT
ncbi:MAG: NTP transferase domain-containing protein [Candidatus Binatia bacterium]|nr:NTP transferase domain-containing protein [Candidatus Binatia bacterium]